MTDAPTTKQTNRQRHAIAMLVLYRNKRRRPLRASPEESFRERERERERERGGREPNSAVRQLSTGCPASAPIEYPIFPHRSTARPHRQQRGLWLPPGPTTEMAAPTAPTT